MKPREFDDLVRQKFDEGSFEYNPGNWHRLDAQLEAKTKKKSMVIWWMPLMAIAAAVTVSMGFATYMQQAEPILTPSNTGTVASNQSKHTNIHTADIHPGVGEQSAAEEPNSNAPEIESNNKTPLAEAREAVANYEPRLDGSYLMSNSVGTKTKQNPRAQAQEKLLQLSQNAENKTAKLPVERDNRKVYRTFADEPQERSLRSQISLAGGLNMGNRNSGFTVGATGRKMVSDRLFVEGDIAITGSNNTQKTAYINDAGIYGSAKMSSAGTRTTSGDATLTTQAGSASSTVVVADRAFNMYYAQVTPTIGYQIAKRIALGVGPDFQQALSDTRPAPSTLDRNNVQVAPMFDIGMVGKAEVLLNDRLRAALVYREGINNIVTPMDKYVERSYMQVQIKYTVFNRQ